MTLYNDALVVLNPRNIDVTMRAFKDLPITKIYLRGWSEARIADVGWNLARSSGHNFYWVASDDIIVRPAALKALRDQTLVNGFLTGYSQRSHTDWTVNLCSEPLQGDYPTSGAYRFLEFRDVVSNFDQRIPTTFTGMSLTGATAELWDEFPFGVFRDKPEDPGFASDFHLSMRLRDAEVPITAVRDAFCYHWRHEWVNTADPRDESPVVGAEQVVISE